jgi:ATP-dependent DNA helicase PIF1
MTEEIQMGMAAGTDLAVTATSISPDDSLLESLEITTGHVQRGQTVDENGNENEEDLQESIASMPDRMLAMDDAPTPCAFITGIAGSGKTFTVRERCATDPTYAALASSTGISAINLNTVTIHSLLGFFDTDSLRDAYIKGGVQTKLRKLVKEGYRNVIIDECSMISKDVLDLLIRAFDDVNMRLVDEGQSPVGLILTGDFLQLPAIADRPAGASFQKGRRKAVAIPWAFHSQFWPRFEKNMTRLTKVWRQADPRFLAALNFARSGRGRDCLQVLQSAGQKFESFVDHDFNGTTIVGKNDEVDRINQIRLDRVKGRQIQLPSRRWAAGGKVRQEWKHIPERTLLRENCYVMILANKYVDGAMVYANGDCGWVRGIQPSVDKMIPPSVMVELVRTGEIVNVESLVRGIEHGERPDWIGGEWTDQGEGEDGKFCAQPHYRRKKRRHVTGQIEYYPLRVCYASTVHKCQGLSIDRCQVDFRGWMYKSPAMLYTALSRCRTLEGLRLVGMPDMLIERCVVDKEAARWL